MGRRLKDLTGQRFGKLVITKRTGVYGKRNVLWLCRCDCGTERELMGCNLYNGTTTSCGCKGSLPPGVAGYNHLFRDYRDSARKRDLTFDIPKEDFLVLVQKDCHYCGSPPWQSLRVRYRKSGLNHRYLTTHVHSGLDRKDNTLGYSIENCVPCCLICNRAKYTLSLDEFQNWIKRLLVFHGEKI